MQVSRTETIITQVCMEAVKGASFEDAIREAMIYSLAEMLPVQLAYNDLNYFISPLELLSRWTESEAYQSKGEE